MVLSKEIIKNSENIIENLGDLNNNFSGKRDNYWISRFLGCQFLHYFYLLNKSSILKKTL